MAHSLRILAPIEVSTKAGDFQRAPENRMNQDFELRITSPTAGRLATTSQHFADRSTLAQKVPLSPPSVPTLYEFFNGDEALVYLMTDSHSLHLSLWRSSEEWGFLCNLEREGEQEPVDIGWQSYPAWTVTHDFEVARRAVVAFIEDGRVDQALRWIWETA